MFDIMLLSRHLAEARKEITLNDLTTSQWHRVCNRFLNCLHKQGVVKPDDWDIFMAQACGCLDCDV